MGKKPLYRETDTGYGFVPPANWLDEETVASGSALAQGSKYDELRFAPVADKADLPAFRLQLFHQVGLPLRKRAGKIVVHSQAFGQSSGRLFVVA